MTRLLSLLVLFSNAIILRRDILTLFNRVAILLLICILNGLFSLTVVTKGIGLHGGLLLNTFRVINFNYTYIYKISINLSRHSTLSTWFSRLSMGAILAQLKWYKCKIA